MAIDWDHLTQPRFDRIVEALVHRLYAVDAEVEVMNGRGGDGGIDIKVTVDGRVWIYQLKYFPDGFPGSYQGRRAGIKRSFRKALEHDPDDCAADRRRGGSRGVRPLLVLRSPLARSCRAWHPAEQPRAAREPGSGTRKRVT
ncbi:hypothetical protein ACFYN3_14170 [Streptomyces lavendulae]|uniref:hypothetical protein n=1 Tax=Streptomyces lavendulae TaxID=1914 RepID=UPI0036878FCE